MTAIIRSVRLLSVTLLKQNQVQHLADLCRWTLPINLRPRYAIRHCACRNLCTASAVQVPEHVQEEEPDALYRRLSVEVKGHDTAVLDSYQKFVTMAARELDVDLYDIKIPPRHIWRRSLLKSVHIFKKHRVQYEIRTHYRLFSIKHITGSTADTFLEYIQRNLPEGVAMKVTKGKTMRFKDDFEDLSHPHHGYDQASHKVLLQSSSACSGSGSEWNKLRPCHLICNKDQKLT